MFKRLIILVAPLALAACVSSGVQIVSHPTADRQLEVYTAAAGGTYTRACGFSLKSDPTAFVPANCHSKTQPLVPLAGDAVIGAGLGYGLSSLDFPDMFTLALPGR